MSRKFSTQRPPRDELSRENARLTREIAELEDALILHRRNINSDGASIQKLIRQEAGISHWFRGGEGKLSKYHSKKDLAEVQSITGKREASNNKEHSASLPRGNWAAGKLAGPVYLKKSQDTAPPNNSSGDSSFKQKKTTGKFSKGSWSMGHRSIKPHGKEYKQVMQNFFGEDGCPLEKDYDIKAASVGLSLYKEKDETDINEKKSKVLKRASAVLIMRPKSASSAKAIQVAESVLSGRQRAMSATTGKGHLAVSHRCTKKCDEANPLTTLIISDPSARDRPLTCSKSGSKQGPVKSASASQQQAVVANQQQKITDAEKDKPKSEAGENVMEDDGLIVEKQYGVKQEGKVREEDMTCVLSLFPSHESQRPKSLNKQVLLDSSYCHYPKSNRNWDKNAKPKPWDKWRDLKPVSSSLEAKDGSVLSKSWNDLDVILAGDSRKNLSLDKGGRTASKVQSQSHIAGELSLTRRWNASAEKYKVPANGSREPCLLHSLSDSLAQDVQPKSSAMLGKQGSMNEIMNDSKHRAVANWLDKHVHRNVTHTQPPDTSDSASDTNIGITEGSSEEDIYLTSGKLAELVARAAKVEMLEPGDRVAAWLDSLDLKERELYQQIFSQHQIDLVDVLSLTTSILQHIGVIKVGPLMKIMRGVDHLKKQVLLKTKTMKRMQGIDLDRCFWDLFPQKQMPFLSRHVTVTDAVTTDDPKQKKLRTNILQMDVTAVSAKTKAMKALREAVKDKPDQVPVSPSQRAETLRNSLREMYQQLKKDKSPVTQLHHISQTDQAPLSGFSKDRKDMSSQDTSPFDCTDLPDADRVISDTSTFVLSASSQPETAQMSIVKKMLPAGAVSCKNTIQSAMVGASMVKLHTKKSNDRVKAQKEMNSTRFIDSSTEHLAEKFAQRRKKREHEEALLEQRLCRMRRQRDAMAARHKIRERSRSLDGVYLPLTEPMLKGSRRLSDSGLETDLNMHTPDNTEELSDMGLFDTLKDSHHHPRASLSSQLLTSQVQEEVAALLQTECSGLEHTLQSVTLNAVRKLKNKLHHLEQSLMLNSVSPTLAGAAAEPLPNSGSFRDFFCGVNGLNCPGADGAARGRLESGINSFHQDLRPRQDGEDEILLSRQMMPPQQQIAENLGIQGQKPHILTCSLSRSTSQGKSFKVPLEDCYSDRNFNSNVTFEKPFDSDMFIDGQGVFNNSAPIVADCSQTSTFTILSPTEIEKVRVGEEFMVPCKKQLSGDNRAVLSKSQSTILDSAINKGQILDQFHCEKDVLWKQNRQLKSEQCLQYSNLVKESNIDPADIEYSESDLIGQGAFSQVFYGKYQGKEVAIKRLKAPLSSLDRSYLAAEMSLLCDLQHACIVRLVGVSCVNLPVMVLEFMSGGDLYSRIHSSVRPSINYAEFCQISHDIASGMAYMHSHRPPVLHLDLKSINILLTSSHKAKIANFGFSKLKHDAGKRAFHQKQVKGVKESPAWMAPELLQGSAVTPKADVFSFGIILWEMVSRRHPYEGSSVFQILEHVQMDRRPEIPECCPADLAALIIRCWNQNPVTRPNFKEVLKLITDLSFPDGWLAVGLAIPAMGQVISTNHALIDPVGIQQSSLSHIALHSELVKAQEPCIEGGSSSSLDPPVLTCNTNLKSPGDVYTICEREISSDKQLATFVSSAHLSKQGGKERQKGNKSDEDDKNNCDGNGDKQTALSTSCTSNYNWSEDNMSELEDSLDYIVKNSDKETDFLEPSMKSAYMDNKSNFMQLPDFKLNYKAGIYHTPSLSMFSHGKDTRQSARCLQSNVGKTNRVVAVPALALDVMHCKSPKPMLVSTCSLFDSVDVNTMLPVSPGHQHKLRWGMIDAQLTPIVPRLHLANADNESEVEPPLAESPAHNWQEKMSSKAVTDNGKKLKTSTSNVAKNITSKNDIIQQSGIGQGETDKTNCDESRLDSNKFHIAADRLRLPVLQPGHCSPFNVKKASQQLMWCQSESSEPCSIALDSLEEAVDTAVCFDKDLNSHAREQPSSIPRLKRRTLFHTSMLSLTSVDLTKADNDFTNQHAQSSNKLHKEKQKRWHKSDCPQPIINLPCLKSLTAPTTLPQNDFSSLPVDPSLPSPAPSFTLARPEPFGSLSQDLQTQHKQQLASVHQELMQRCQSKLKFERQTSPLADISCTADYMKDRFQGNPHFSVEASTLQEMKSQLRSSQMPHPMQIHVLPSLGQAGISLTDLLQKVMGERRFAMGESAAATSSSQDITDVSWSTQDD